MQEKTFEILCKKISGLFTGNIHKRVHSLLFLLLLLLFFCIDDVFECTVGLCRISSAIFTCFFFLRGPATYLN